MPAAAAAIVQAAAANADKNAAAAAASTVLQVGPEGDESRTLSKGKKGRKKDQAAAAVPQKVYFPKFWQYQPQAHRFYSNIKIQMGVAGLISGNFVCNIIEKWIDPKGTEYAVVWKVFETFWNVMFTIELGLNMYASWLCNFWKSGWNVFDFIVVTIGLLTTFEVPLPGPFSMLRMMRAFRVFRLFKRVKSLNKIMVSLAKALPGVGNAFVILLLVMSIYAIIAVDLFREYGSHEFTVMTEEIDIVNGTKQIVEKEVTKFGYINIKGESVAFASGRSQKYGYEYFDNFGKSLYTMFQVITGDSWSEVIARPLLMCNSVVDAFGVAFFFVSFVIVNGVVLINVVVAVLLEKMVDDPTSKDDEDDDEESDDGEDEELQDDEDDDEESDDGEDEELQEDANKKEVEEKAGHNGQAEQKDFTEAKAHANGDAKEIKENAKLIGEPHPGDRISVQSERVVTLKADLEAMKYDMVNIQANLSHILQLMEIKVDSEKLPPTTPLEIQRPPPPEGGPRNIGVAGSEEQTAAPTVTLPGSLDAEK
eukprot:TRINITY_DN95_c0_g1_i1.p1 TRINITY_DN95_c0_g1~~TRINITY_DN95_c0_g1_i1.p1  ORF type:complete len:536 (-),score=147.76 TRINITY_DN95_c0_g1_i1:68-1675(-)